MLRPLWSRKRAVPTRPPSRFRRSSQVAKVDHGEKTVLLDSRSEQFYALDETGQLVWALMAEPRTAAEIVASLRRTFEVPEEQVSADVAAFLADLERARLIEPVG
jgi:hypothetical protein